MFLTNLFDAGMVYDTPALLNRGIDRNHRSFLSAVEGAQLGTFRPRTSREWLRVDPRHVPWYAYVHISTQLCFVMRQFGLRQAFPGNVQPTVPPADHS